MGCPGKFSLRGSAGSAGKQKALGLAKDWILSLKQGMWFNLHPDRNLKYHLPCRTIVTISDTKSEVCPVFITWWINPTYHFSPRKFWYCWRDRTGLIIFLDYIQKLKQSGSLANIWHRNKRMAYRYLFQYG